MYVHDPYNETRLFLFDKAIKEGFLFPRWASDYFLGRGSAMFNYYPPLFNYMAEIFKLIGFNIVNSIKLTNTASIFFSFIFMYLLAKELWGKKAGIISAIIYTLSPYRIADLYVRGAFSEHLALTFIPLLFFFVIKIFNSKKSVFIFLTALSYCLLILSHNLTALIVTPFSLAWILFFIFKSKDIKSGLLSFSGMILGAAFSAFYSLPAILEKNFVNGNMGLISFDNDFHNHFLNFFQLFFTKWDYGTSVAGNSDKFPFAIGFALTIVLITGIIKIILSFRTKLKFLIFLILSTAVVTLFTLPVSKLLWENIPLMAYLQFPWRFELLILFFLSIASGLLLKKWKYTYIFLIFTFLLIIPTTWPFTYLSNTKDNTDFQPTVRAVEDLKWYETQRGKYDSILIHYYAYDYDYIPATADVKKEIQTTTDFIINNKNTNAETLLNLQEEQFPLVINESCIVEIKDNISQYKKFALSCTQNSKLKLNLFDFPGWTVLSDGQKIEHSTCEGLICFDNQTGNRNIEVIFEDTSIRKAAKSISIFSFLISGSIICSFLFREILKRVKNPLTHTK